MVIFDALDVCRAFNNDRAEVFVGHADIESSVFLQLAHYAVLYAAEVGSRAWLIAAYQFV